MTHYCQPAAPKTLNELTGILADYQLLCDPEFDADHEELERQFAELRMQLRSE